MSAVANQPVSTQGVPLTSLSQLTDLLNSKKLTEQAATATTTDKSEGAKKVASSEEIDKLLEAFLSVYAAPLTTTHKVAAADSLQQAYTPSAIAGATQVPRFLLLTNSNDISALMVQMTRNISLQSVQAFQNMFQSLDALTKIPMENIMQLWQLTSSLTESLAKKQQDDINKQLQSMAEKVGCAAKMGMGAGAGEIIGGIIAAVATIAAIVAAPVTGGASIALLVTAATLSIGAAGFMVADGATKMQANYQLLQASQKGGLDAQNALNELQGLLQGGIYFLMADKNMALAAKIQMAIDITGAVGSMGIATGEILATKTALLAAETASAKALIYIQKAIVALNTLTSFAGMAGSIADPTGESVDHDQHTLTMWQAFNAGMLGALFWSLMDTKMGNKTMLERSGGMLEGMGVKDSSEITQMIIASLALLALGLGQGYLQGKIMGNLKVNTSNSLLSNQKYLLAQMSLSLGNIAKAIGQAGQNMEFGLMQADQMKMNAENSRDFQKLSLLQKMVEQLSQTDGDYIKDRREQMTSGLTKQLTDMFESLGQLYTTQGQMGRYN